MKVLVNSLLVIPFIFTTQISFAGDDVKKLSGASWVAQKDIPFAPRKSTMYVQDGHVVTQAKNGDRYAPYCQIISKKKLDDTLTIKKGTKLKISRTTYHTNAESDITSVYITVMSVSSVQYPVVTRIECSTWGGNSDSYLSLEQMQQTMAGVFTLLPD